MEEGAVSTKPAGLASMETLDDSNGSTKHSEEKADEGLETVKLDSAEVILFSNDNSYQILTNYPFFKCVWFSFYKL